MDTQLASRPNTDYYRLTFLIWVKNKMSKCSVDLHTIKETTSIISFKLSHDLIVSKYETTIQSLNFIRYTFTVKMQPAALSFWYLLDFANRSRLSKLLRNWKHQRRCWHTNLSSHSLLNFQEKPNIEFSSQPTDRMLLVQLTRLFMRLKEQKQHHLDKQKHPKQTPPPSKTATNKQTQNRW